MKLALIALLFTPFSAEAESGFSGIKLRGSSETTEREAPAQGNASAAGLCREIAPGGSWDVLVRNFCLKTASKIKSEAAVELCRQMAPPSDGFDLDDRMICLEIIAEKKLSDPVIIACGQIDPGAPSGFTGDNRLECLRNAAGKQEKSSIQTEGTGSIR